jgi:hypothetical protein
MLNVLDQLEEAIAVPQRGRAIVAHLLLPHFPYVLTPECNLKPPEHWYVNHAFGGRDVPEEEIYRGLWDQLACTNKRLILMLDQALKSPDAKDMVVFIHGDHGARIKNGSKSKDERDIYQTAMLIRSRGVKPGIIFERKELQAFFAAAFKEFLEGIRR